MDFSVAWVTPGSAARPPRLSGAAGRAEITRWRSFRAERVAAAVEALEATDWSTIVSFTIEQSRVAGQALAMSAVWMERLTQNTTPISASEPLFPALWDALYLERALISRMFGFRFAADSGEAWQPYLENAKAAELALNDALARFQSALGRLDVPQVLALLSSVQAAAEAVRRHAENGPLGPPTQTHAA